MNVGHATIAVALALAACSTDAERGNPGSGGHTGASGGAYAAGGAVISTGGNPPSGSGGTPVASGGSPGTGGSGAPGTGGLPPDAGAGGLPPDGRAGGLPPDGGLAGSGGAFTREGGTALPADPGTGPWVPVPAADVLSVCRLDPAKLAEADQKLGAPWAVVRYGRLCHSFRAAGMAPEEAWSTTKTLGAAVAGAVAYATRGLPRTGPKTGPFSDEDRVDAWLDVIPYNPNAHVAHVLSMVAHNPDLSLGRKTMAYDTIGTTQINTLSAMLTAAVVQDSARLGPNLEEFTQRFLFRPLGMTTSSWNGGAADKVFAFSWSTTVLDMARLGLLLHNGGLWSGTRVLEEEWVYRMTHPAFEDGNTGYGYLTWLNAASNHHFGGIPGPPIGPLQGPLSPGPCAPVSVYPSHPHGLSDSPDCNYAAPYTCPQQHDVGVWQAVGLFGQVIQGHPGLDLVVVGKNLTPVDTGPSAPRVLWDAVLPAVVSADPTYAGDEAAFCTAYGGNRYAPDAR